MGSITPVLNASSRFSSLEAIPLDGPFALEIAYRKDPHPSKVNLGIGAYRDDEDRPWVLSAVKEAKARLALGDWTHEYLAPQGDDAFLRAARATLFGNSTSPVDDAATASIQTVSGTGANSLIARFVDRYVKPAHIWIPDPTWVNHFKIWTENAPGVSQRLYPYYDPTSINFDYDGMIATLRQHAVPGDAVLLHACAQNPTGLDPSKAQWQAIADLCEEKQLFVIFDVAYQGFASGDLDEDAWSVRHFLARPNLELAVCQSFSKNFGLYGERVGVLHIVVARGESATMAPAVRSRLIALQRPDISMAPRFGSQVAGLVLSNNDLYKLWLEDLAIMTGRIKSMRQALHDELVRLGTPGDWGHILKQTGMFSYTGLSKTCTAALQSRYHIYMLDTGRLSVCGLTSHNVKYVADSIHTVVVEERGQQKQGVLSNL